MTVKNGECPNSNNNHLDNDYSVKEPTRKPQVFPLKAVLVPGVQRKSIGNKRAFQVLG